MSWLDAVAINPRAELSWRESAELWQERMDELQAERAEPDRERQTHDTHS